MNHPSTLVRAVLCCAGLGMAGCTPGPDLGGYDLTPSPGLRDAPWPRLVDVPTPPPPGDFDAAVPDPARGQSVLDDLGPEAQRMTARAARLAAPVLTEAERRWLTGGGR